jgi:ATP-binding cassette subfamily C (CFTR/MRP) protein 4
MTSDYWLQRWASQSPRNQDDDTNLHVFLGLTLGTASLALFNSIMFFTATNRANSSIHHRALARVLRAPMHFFTSNPLGRILNRFSADLGQVDELLPARAFDTLMLASQTVGALVVVCLALPWLCIGLPLLFWYLVHIRTFVTKSLRELKRLEGVSRSPVYAMFSADLAGLTYIRR